MVVVAPVFGGGHRHAGARRKGADFHKCCSFTPDRDSLEVAIPSGSVERGQRAFMVEG